jgi:hypothetical protein
MGNSYTLAMILFVIGIATMLATRHGVRIRGSRLPSDSRNRLAAGPQ